MSSKYDFTKPGSYPRSGYEALGGILFLPRSIDKMRAHIAGTVGEYVAHRGFSMRVYELFGVTSQQFEEAVRANDTDEGVLQWLYTHSRRPTTEEIEAYNTRSLQYGPQTPEQWKGFRDFLEKIGHGHRTDLTHHFDRYDLDEGREVPIGGRKV